MKNRIILICVWVIVAIIWGIYRHGYNLPEFIEEVLLKPLIFLTPPAIYIAIKERINFEAWGLRTKSLNKIFGWGFGIGTFLVVENIMIWFIKGHSLRLLDISIVTLVKLFIIALATSLTEELLYRGFLLERFWQVYNNSDIANWLSTLLFTIGHLGIAVFRFRYQGLELLNYALLIMILGYLEGFIYIKTRSTYATTIAHFLWNFSNVLIV